MVTSVLSKQYRIGTVSFYDSCRLIASRRDGLRAQSGSLERYTAEIPPGFLSSASSAFK
jgi:hypothetical protein